VTVTGTPYAKILQIIIIIIIIIIIDLFSNEDCYFQRDGPPLHYYTRVRDFLDAHFPRRGTGRRGRVEWIS
jgi:hypothetical protein